MSFRKRIRGIQVCKHGILCWCVTYRNGIILDQRTNNYVSLQAISCHYASSHCQYIDVRGTTQESLEDEVLEVARRKLKRLGADSVSGINFSDIWSFKGRLVQGERIGL